MAFDRPARFIRLDGTHFDRDLREYAPVVAFPKPGETPPLHAGKLHSFRVTDRWRGERRIYEQEDRTGTWEPLLLGARPTMGR